MNPIKLENCGITLLFNHGGMSIELYDEDAAFTFTVVILNQEQTCLALSRLAHTKCKTVLYGLEKVGKKMIHKTLTFPMPKDDYYSSERCEIAVKEMMKYIPEGWESDGYFGSQGSFFLGKDAQPMARVTIRKWE